MPHAHHHKYYNRTTEKFQLHSNYIIEKSPINIRMLIETLLREIPTCLLVKWDKIPVNKKVNIDPPPPSSYFT